jgi:uncharacterized protein YdeI (YjbR/CyaY-like superfamily)
LNRRAWRREVKGLVRVKDVRCAPEDDSVMTLRNTRSWSLRLELPAANCQPPTANHQLMSPTPKFFRTPAALAKWFATHGARKTELWIGYYKKASGKGGVVYRQALDEALRVGWIDGHVKSIDDERYMQRFTPRTAKSIWSAVNIRRVGELTAEGRMLPTGLATFERRDPKRAGLYSFENRPQELPPEFAKRFRADKTAWAFFEAQPPGYRRTVIFLVVSAKQEATRVRRLEHLIACSARGERIQQLVSTPRRPAPNAKP